MIAGRVASVFFDWNGTLVDDRHRAWTAARSTLATIAPHRRPPSDHVLESAWCLPVSAFFVALGVAAERAIAAERMWNIEMTMEPPVLRDGAHELIVALRHAGCTVGVVSAGLPSMLVRDLATTRLATVLDVLVAGATDKGAVLRSFAGPAPLVYVGDSEADMHAATQAGALAVGVEGGYRPASALLAAGAVSVLCDLDELYELIGVGRSNAAGWPVG